ncbi:testis-expressed protein 43 [Alligator mississippiensis]|uniref:Testis-expressed sequence 43 protein isoform A n=1 Tax=Alligator mississippiensis TaxID=8496 RepID=A0A151M7W9_ALLMI|nr:testis-expressed protein 43 [Alligator mississippiensis]KYO20595.1 testis-expressed sequence 43 protein isoform A [Alligator mississippiensis]
MVGARCLLSEYPCLHPPRPGWALGWQRRLTHCHLPELSRKHGMIPDQYVMPWKEDMKNRHFALKHAKLAGIYSGAVEDSLFLEHRERHCHGEDRKLLRKKISYEMVIQDVPLHCPLSRYQKSAIAHACRRKL